MAGKSTVRIEILGDAGPAQKMFGALEKSAGGVTGALGKAGKAFGGMAKVAGGFVLGSAILNAPGALMGMAEAAAEDAASMDRLKQAVENAEGSFEGHAAAIDGAIRAGQALAFSDDDVRSGLSLMTAQLGDADEAMNRLPLAMDLARGAGISLEQASKLLGKTSEENTTALSRLGIVLGDTATEQDVLNAVDAKFGGQAGKFAASDAGKFAKLRDRLGEVQEAIGAKLLPVFVALADVVATKVLPFVERLIDRLSGPMQAAFVFVRDSILTFVQALQGNWTDDSKIVGFHRVIGQIGTVIREQVIPAVFQIAGFIRDKLWPIFQQGMEIIGSLVSAFGEGGFSGVLKRLGEVFKEFAPIVLEALGELLVQVGDWIVNTGVPWVAERLGQWADAFGSWAVDAVPPMLENLALLLEDLGTWFADTGLPGLLDKLGEWGQALIDWIEPRIEPMLEALGELLLAVTEWIVTDALPAIAEKLLEWGAQFVAWVGPVLEKLPAELSEIANTIIAFIQDDAGPRIKVALQVWSDAFVDWTTDVDNGLPPQLLAIGQSIILFINGHAPSMSEALRAWSDAMVFWTTDVLVQLPARFQQIKDAIRIFIAETIVTISEGIAGWVNAFIDWVQRDVIPKIGPALDALSDAIMVAIAEIANDAAAEARSIGAGVVAGVVAGIASMAGQIYDALMAIVDAAIDKAKDKLLIFSPSKVTAKEIGEPMAAGIARGILDGSPMVAGAVATVVNNALAVGGGMVTGSLPGGGVGGNMPGPSGPGVGGGMVPMPLPPGLGSPPGPGTPHIPGGPKPGQPPVVVAPQPKPNPLDKLPHHTGHSTGGGGGRGMAGMRLIQMWVAESDVADLVNGAMTLQGKLRPV